MNKIVKEEVISLIREFKLDCNIEKFKNKINWDEISSFQKLSESFIREFKDEVNWSGISSFQKLSEHFIREFQCKVNWINISRCQWLSEDFIKEFQDKVSWINISRYQKLSESFIREFQDKVNWDEISSFQKLSEEFIALFENKVNWYNVSYCQILSKNFIKEFGDNIDIKIQNLNHKVYTVAEKMIAIKNYAKKHNLKFDGKYLYAFREHDEFGRGMFNKTIFYKKGEYYRDWHCDMNENNRNCFGCKNSYVFNSFIQNGNKYKNSFGLGIFPQGNTKVKVKVEDWGIEVSREDGKARVWGFEII